MLLERTHCLNGHFCRYLRALETCLYCSGIWGRHEVIWMNCYNIVKIWRKRANGRGRQRHPIIPQTKLNPTNRPGNKMQRPSAHKFNAIILRGHPESHDKKKYPPATIVNATAKQTETSPPQLSIIQEATEDQNARLPTKLRRHHYQSAKEKAQHGRANKQKKKANYNT